MLKRKGERIFFQKKSIFVNKNFQSIGLSDYTVKEAVAEKLITKEQAQKLFTMKKFFSKVSLLACLCLFPAIPMMAQDDKPATLQVANSEPQKTYTVIIFEDGTRAIYEGKLTNEEIAAIYTAHNLEKRKVN